MLWNTQSSSHVDFFCPLFLPPLRRLLCHQNSLIKKCSKAGAFLFNFWSRGPIRVDVECTLTLDCVGCVLFFWENHLHSIHSNVTFSHHNIALLEFYPFCSYCCSYVWLGQCLSNLECASLDFEPFLFTLYLYISELLIWGWVVLVVC